ncbi:MAG: sensor domain-containing diguanylate cyclase [Solirubrobacterales bacterium]|nr:sensor domain-containing diguanylate cyclase [Solirubrobacterales bacterium]
MTAQTKADVPAATLEALMDAAQAVLAADSLEETFGRITRRLSALVPLDDLVIYEVEAGGARLQPVFAEGAWVEEVMAESFSIDEGITGAAVRAGRVENVPRSDLDPRCSIVAGTDDQPEALVCVPLVVDGRTIAALNVYRNGADVAFNEQEASVIERFAAMAALAFHSARQREQLRAQARSDPLTGLLNHRALHERLEEELERSRRSGLPLAAVALDLDHFKAVNDTHGHGEGDRTLIEVAKRLRSTVRAVDAVARLGGEEFVVLAPGVEGELALRAAERARRAIGEIEIDGLRLSASAGVAVFPVDAADCPTLLDRADAALYRAKRSGRDRTCVAEAPREPGAKPPADPIGALPR